MCGSGMVFDWLRNLADPPPERRAGSPRARAQQKHAAGRGAEAGKRRRAKLRRFCEQCGAALSGRRRRYCSQTCWRRRDEFGTARVVAGIHRATNAERGAAYKNPVRRDRALDSIAQDHAADMARRGYFAHKSPNGTTDTDRALAAGYQHKWAGAGRVWIMDNIGMMTHVRCGRGTARRAVRSWIESPPHRQNMLYDLHARLGVGVAVGRHGMIYFVQAFS